MYNTFFDFQEKPFQLVPNPDFLFLGKSHEEALAHLTYATSQGDGFVEITGEIGTGKTTLCRVFLEDLDTTVEAAFIFNSKLNSVQLLKTIHSELGIACSDTDPVDLTRVLNQFLLEKKTQGKSVILLIDEAQNLEQETLEQLRLLSNLETTRSKLLQIILVGQPELSDILDAYEMRQLRQRINLSCHILPMTLKETRDYIDHRVNVASRRPRTLFTRRAQTDIYTYSRGIPRLINIVCDRSLVAGYSLDQKKINRATVRLAIKELSPPKHWLPKHSTLKKKRAWAFFSFIFIALVLVIFFNTRPVEWKFDIISENPLSSLLKTGEAVQTPSTPIVSRVEHTDTTTSKKNLLTTPHATFREDVFSHVVSLWNHTPLMRPDPLTDQIEADPDFFILAAAQNHFQLLHLKGDLDRVRQYNLPAILGVVSPDRTENRYLVVDQITPDNEVVLFPGPSNGQGRMTLDDLLPFLTGEIYIPWKDGFGYTRVISETASKASIVQLKLLLRRIGFSEMDLTPVYNDPVEQAVQQIQAKYGLVQDGRVGPLTKIMLYNEQKQVNTPFLDPTRPAQFIEGPIK